jgi:uncharacterized membrane protein
MPTINETVTINADIDSVFDLVSRIEDFPRYATVLKEVRKIGPLRYRWTAQAAGITLQWDSVITDYVRPTRIAWRSVSGFPNVGAYSLASIAGGTKVSITIEYRFPNRLVAMLLAPLGAPLVRTYAGEILQCVKHRLESTHRGGDEMAIRSLVGAGEQGRR